jgi:hypothetical protein
MARRAGASKRPEKVLHVRQNLEFDSDQKKNGPHLSIDQGGGKRRAGILVFRHHAGIQTKSNNLI